MHARRDYRMGLGPLSSNAPNVTNEPYTVLTSTLKLQCISVTGNEVMLEAPFLRGESGYAHELSARLGDESKSTAAYPTST